MSNDLYILLVLKRIFYLVDMLTRGIKKSIYIVCYLECLTQRSVVDFQTNFQSHICYFLSSYNRNYTCENQKNHYHTSCFVNMFCKKKALHLLVYKMNQMDLCIISWIVFCQMMPGCELIPKFILKKSVSEFWHPICKT